MYVHCFHLNPTLRTRSDSIFVFDFMKKKIHIVWFSLQTDSVFLLVVWAPVVFLFFFCALHLALLSDFLPSRLRRVAAAAAAAVAV